MSNPVLTFDLTFDKYAGFVACVTYLCKPVLQLILLLQMYVLYRRAPILLDLSTGVLLLFVLFSVTNLPRFANCFVISVAAAKLPVERMV